MNILEFTKLAELNHELLDVNRSLLSRIIRLYKENHIPLETVELEALLINVGNILQKFDQPTGNIDKNNLRGKRI